ncbi:LamG domain-containing protein [Micromonospora sp. B11E3]|uniref:LamG domain-containing protein n=1 Tax=Micromonospora sp. B11E3 TaxID=3153562 RepID=UPI00325EC14C
MTTDRSSSRPARGVAYPGALRLAAACAAVLLPLAGGAVAYAKPGTAVASDRPAPPTALWGLEAYPGTTQVQALADRNAAPSDTPLTASGVSWQGDARLLGAQTVAFDGASSYLSASPSALNTAGTFSLAAWVRLTDTSVSRVFASKASSGQATLSAGYDSETNRWLVLMPSKTGKGARWSAARSVSVPQVGLWAHLAVVHDASAHTLTLRVNGVAEATVGNVTAVDDPTGQVRLGRGDTTWWQGNLADARVYDRALVDQDFTGWLASDPGSGGFDEPGLLRPVQVGRWAFELATPCYEENLDPSLCYAGDASVFGRRLALTKGADVTAGQRGNALALDDTHWIEDPTDPHYGEATQEYGRTQSDVLDPETFAGQDVPVLRTDQSFTLSTWVRLDPTRGAQTVLSQDAVDRSVLRLSYEPADGGRWEFGMLATATADESTATYATAPAARPDQWHHLVAVLDATHREARLYVDGTLAEAVGLNPAWQPYQATGPLLVGRSTTLAGPAGWLYGQVDDLGLYQGALSAAEVQRLFDAEAVRPVPLPSDGRWPGPAR